MKDIKGVTFYSRTNRDTLAHLRFYGPARRLGLRVIDGVENDRVYPERVMQGDLVVLQRDFPLDWAAYAEIKQLAHRQGKPVIFELDDLLLELPPDHPDRHRHYYARALLPMFKALTEADAVTVSTARLREYALQYNPNVIVLPNCLDDELWHMRPPSSVAAEDGTVVIGYMGGTSHAPDLEMIESVLTGLDDRYPGRLRFRFWGVKPPRSLGSRPNVDWQAMGFYKYPAFAGYFQGQSADIFIAPLQENLFNGCKSPIKYFEYSALGGCGVFSRMDPYASVVEEGIHGLLATSLPEWTEALSRLIEDRDLRLRLAANAQEDIKSKWLLSANANRWLEAYQAVSIQARPESSLGRLITSIAEQTTADRLDMQRQVTLLSSQLEEKDAELQEKDTRIVQIEQVLSGIYQSRSWRLVQVMQRTRAILVPHGSRRAKLVREAVQGVRGVRLFALRVQRQLATGIRETPPGRFVSQMQRERELNAPAKEVSLAFDHPISKSPRVSIVIPLHNHIEYTLDCLLSIAACQAQTDYEVIVMDDTSTDETRRLLEGIKGLRYVRNPENLGFVRSCNRAAKEACGDYLLFLNNDTRVHPGWLDRLLETFSVVPRTGLAGSKLIWPDGRLQEAGGVIWADGSAMNYGRGGDPSDYRYNFARQADYVSGASLLIPRPLWDQLGGFDETYQPAYYEDVDLAFRVRRAGYKVIYQPFSEVTHIEGGTNGMDLNSGIKRYQVVNRGRFYDAWQASIASNGLPGSSPETIPTQRYARASVLFIDDLIPKPDQHAGGVLSEFYISTLAEAGYAVTFLPHADIGYPGSYAEALQRKGVECVYSPYITSSQEYIRRYGSRFDYIVVSRASVASELIDTIKTFAPLARIVFNTIDLHFLRFERAAQVSGREEDSRKAQRVREDELSIMRKSDCTLVVSDVEASLLSDILPTANIARVPFPADIHPVQNPFAARKDIVFLGGFEHTPNVDAVLFFARDVWPLLQPHLPEARFVIAGAGIVPEVQALQGQDIAVEGYVENLDRLFAEAKMSIAPLRYGAGLKGKVLMSLGYGVPCVASTIATEGTGLTGNDNILVADEPEEIARAVMTLYGSAELWESLSRRGQEWISQHYSRALVASRLLGIFEHLTVKNAAN